MDLYSEQVNLLVEELGRLPGIGHKSAQRLAYHIINMPLDQVKSLSDSIITARQNVKYCKECYTLTDKEICPICASQNREKDARGLASHCHIVALFPSLVFVRDRGNGGAHSVFLCLLGAPKYLLLRSVQGERQKILPAMLGRAEIHNDGGLELQHVIIRFALVQRKYFMYRV